MKTTVVLKDQGEVSNRLAELGLSQEVCRDAVAVGQVARDSCSANFPGVSIGNYGWGATVAGLRDGLIPLGWLRGGEGFLESTVNAARTLAITVSTGDDGTGLPDGSPRTKNQKGPATVNLCQKNQLSLLARLPGYEQLDAPSSASPDLVTWVLLVHREGDEIRCELSLPASMGLDAHVDEWIERIILAPVRLGGEPDVFPVDMSAPDVDIEVTRRGQSG